MEMDHLTNVCLICMCVSLCVSPRLLCISVGTQLQIAYCSIWSIKVTDCLDAVFPSFMTWVANGSALECTHRIQTPWPLGTGF